MAIIKGSSQAECFARLEQLHPGGRFGMHPLRPGGDVLIDQFPGAVMDRNGMTRLQQPECPQGVLRSHGVVITDGDHCQIDPLFTDQAHITEQTGIAGEINPPPFIGGEQETDRVSTVRTVWQR